jgi:hypothetical protein
MLRVNLLRDLPSSPPPSGSARQEVPATSAQGNEGAGTLRPVLLTLLGLLVLGAVALFLARPPWLNLEGLSGFSDGAANRDTARADSLRQIEALHADASRLVILRQSLAIEWLDQIEAALPPENAAPGSTGATVVTLSSFTTSGAFVLRGAVATAEELSALQEALVLIPGMDLRESRADELETPRSGFSFAFTGTVILPVDTTPLPGNRVIPVGELERHLTLLIEAAALEGVEFNAPRTGATVASGILRLQSYRLTGSFVTADSNSISALRNILAGERHRGSPFGVQRVTMENREGRKTVSLDIMAFTP